MVLPVLGLIGGAVIWTFLTSCWVSNLIFSIWGLSALAGATLVTASLTIGAGLVQFNAFIQEQNDFIRTAGIPNSAGAGTSEENQLAYYVPESQIAKTFRKLDNDHLIFTGWDLETGEAKACWAKGKSSKSDEAEESDFHHRNGMRICMDFSGFFLGCSWDGHHMPNGSVIVRVPGKKAKGEIEGIWHMPKRTPETCWPGFPNGDKPAQKMVTRPKTGKALLEEPQTNRWPLKEAFPKGTTPETQAQASMLAEMHDAELSASEYTDKYGITASALRTLFTLLDVPITHNLNDKRDVATTFTTSTVSTSMAIAESTSVPTTSRPHKPHTSVVDAIFTGLLASYPSANRNAPLGVAELSDTVSSIANLTSALLIHPAHGANVAHETLQHTVKHIMASDYLTQMPELVDHLILTTSRTFARGGEQAVVGEHVRQLGVSATMNVLMDKVHAGDLNLEHQQVLEKMFLTINGKEEGALARR